MLPKLPDTIDEVISSLEDIILESRQREDPLGYFAALYQMVTIRVKEEIANGFFDDGPRVEQLDVVFANRYLEAYYAFRNSGPITVSWQRAFDLRTHYWPVVLQHLLLGMNAHINLDLGIAAAAISRGKELENLKEDFHRINEILSSLVHEVQEGLAAIWPTLKTILKKTGKADDFMVDFSMKLARNGAWRFAQTIEGKSGEELEFMIAARDVKVSRKASLITNPGFIPSLIFKIIRLGERDSVAGKIDRLREK